jgi:hypothetical protein
MEEWDDGKMDMQALFNCHWVFLGYGSVFDQPTTPPFGLSIFPVVHGARSGWPVFGK